MSNTVNVPDVVVTRTNKEGQSFSWTYVYTKLKKKNSADPDRYSFVPVAVNDKIEGRTPTNFLNFVGNDAADLLMAKVRGQSTVLMKYAIEDSIPKNDKGEPTGAPEIENVRANFAKYAAEMSARGESLKSLVEALEDLQTEMIALSMNADLSPVDKVAKITEIGQKMQSIQTAIDEKKAKKESENGDE